MLSTVCYSMLRASIYYMIKVAKEARVLNFDPNTNS